jgi:hypothetical protein
MSVLANLATGATAFTRQALSSVGYKRAPNIATTVGSSIWLERAEHARKTVLFNGVECVPLCGNNGRCALMPEPVHVAAAVVLADSWSNNWLWGVPLVVLTVIIHCFGLFNVRERIVLPLSDALGGQSTQTAFACLIAATVLAITALLAFEAEIWAFAYVALDALPDWSSATLYSLSAMTPYGHADLYLDKHWQLMGALEALNGMMLLGLTTAGLFSVLQSYAPWGMRKGLLAGHDAIPN